MRVKKNKPEVLNLFNTHIGKPEQQVKLNNRDFNTDVRGRRGAGYNFGAASQLNPVLLGTQASLLFFAETWDGNL